MHDYSDRLMNLWSFLRTTATLALAMVLFLLLLGAAFAQDGGVGTPPLVEDPLKALATTAESIATGKWWPAAAGLVSILTWAVRSGVLKNLPKTGALSFLGRIGAWLAGNPIASFITPFALSGALGFVTTFANGTPFTLQTFFQEVLKIGAGAVAAFIAVQKIQEARDAGALAAAGITTQQEALDELRKRVLSGVPAAPPAPPPVVPPVA
jgi:hypothetical protein